MARTRQRADPAATPPFQSVGFLLSTIGYTIARRFHEVLAPLDLEPRQFAVMRALGWDEGRSQQALAAQLQIPPSRMVAIVDGLEARGLVERRPHPEDRRVRTLHLTAAGRRLLGRAFQLALGHERAVSGSLDEAERAQLLALLERIATALDVPREGHSALRDGG